MDNNGNAVAVWIQNDGTFDRMWANRYVTGQGWGTPQVIESIPGSAGFPRVAVNGDGNAMALWRFLGTNHEIWANRYDVVSGSWGTAVITLPKNADQIFKLEPKQAKGIFTDILHPYKKEIPEPIPTKPHGKDVCLTCGGGLTRTQSGEFVCTRCKYGPKKAKKFAMCNCGHSFELHVHPPDFGCPHEKECGCQGATEVDEKVASNQEYALWAVKEGQVESLPISSCIPHQITHADWFADLNLPTVGYAFDKVSRGFARIFKDHISLVESSDLGGVPWKVRDFFREK
jgi:hypothetical protein